MNFRVRSISTRIAMNDIDLTKDSSFSDVLKCEHQYLKVPLESLKKSMRNNHRIIERELAAITQGVTEAAKTINTKEDAYKKTENLLARLHVLKRKIEETRKTDHDLTRKFKNRVDKIRVAKSSWKEEANNWCRFRLNRAVIDYMLRAGYTQSAALFIQEKMLDDHVDAQVFDIAKRVITALRRKDCSVALIWCSANKLWLKKQKANLEFKIRLQEFIEIVRSEQYPVALNYAKQHLGPWAATELNILQLAMGALVFGPNTTCSPYKELFEESRWEELCCLFFDELLEMYGLSKMSLLEIYLQSGLAALKTPLENESDLSAENPLFQDTFQELADPLPFAKHERSKLICKISKEIMDDHNPPLVLPNGYAYGKNALERMAAQNGGKIVCPRSNQVYDFKDLVKAYVM